jgi:hypothetical protein
VSGYVWAVLGFIGGLVMTVLGDMVSEEVRDRLDHVPHAILKLAARRLDVGQRNTVYQDEWLPELTYILKGAETRPITRLITGTRYAFGILVNTRRIARHLHRPEAGEPAKANDRYVGAGRGALHVVLGLVRPIGDYDFQVIVKSAMASTFAGLACGVLTLGVITWRFMITPEAARLGMGSPSDTSVVVFVSNLQTSGVIASLIVCTFVFAVVLRSKFLLPAGVLVASVVHAWLVPISANGIDAGAYHSDLAQSLSVPNSLLFRLPEVSMPVGCLIALMLGLAACGVAGACARS